MHVFYEHVIVMVFNFWATEDADSPGAGEYSRTGGC